MNRLLQISRSGEARLFGGGGCRQCCHLFCFLHKFSKMLISAKKVQKLPFCFRNGSGSNKSLAPRAHLSFLKFDVN